MFKVKVESTRQVLSRKKLLLNHGIPKMSYIKVKWVGTMLNLTDCYISIGISMYILYKILTFR